MIRMMYAVVAALLVLGSGCLDNLKGIPYPVCDGQQSDEELCSLQNAACGAVAVVDNCGEARNIDCGGCPEPNVCGADNTCGCTPLNDDAYCALVNAECGTVTGTDPCGIPRAVACGKCDATDACFGNTCVCEGITDEELCINQGAQCGALSVMDGCGELRELECGTCDEGQSCGADNLCECVPETVAELCARNALNCGDVLEPIFDNCGRIQMDVNCGDCDGPDQNGLSCGAGGTDNVCGCAGSLDVDLCANYELTDGVFGAECGLPQITDACGNMRAVNCGSCQLPETCNGTGEPYVCGCTRETPQQFCDRRGFQCGTVTGQVDNCGMPLDAVDCGTCTSPDECGVAAANRCSCVPESHVQFCQSQSAECGTVTADDQCGNPRTASCGGCPVGERCDLPTNTCECAPETSAQFCTRLNACGTVTDENNCGTTVTVQCGNCQNGGACSSDGQCSNCVPESNAAFCNRLGVFCGTGSGTDNCGAMRSTHCGDCFPPFACEEKVCVCEAEQEDDSYYCEGVMAECGSIYVLDECNETVNANCGACDDPVDSCINNRCQCIPETGGDLCDAQGAECGTISVTDQCGTMRTPFCGTCPGVGGNLLCIGNQCTL